MRNSIKIKISKVEVKRSFLFSQYPVKNCTCGFDLTRWAEDEIVISAYICKEHRIIANRQKKLMLIQTKEPRP